MTIDLLVLINTMIKMTNIKYYNKRVIKLNITMKLLKTNKKSNLHKKK